MSYDVSIGDFDANYTSNLADFFHDHIRAFPLTGLQALHGLTGEDAAEVLGAAIERIYDTCIRLNESGMRGKYNATNGWGSVLGATILLSRLIVACHKHPRLVVDVSS